MAEPGDDAVVVNACESAPYKLAQKVRRTDKFWIKAQPYSLAHMLDGDPLVDLFVGGTVYQAFLSALSYHRWHSPVSGRIVKTCVVDGTYYSETLTEGPDRPGRTHRRAISPRWRRGRSCLSRRITRISV
ncbi:phosphatidylserine decarboxylase [Alkalilimnicola ehrlichii]|uniref:phosphatidylserine decarboxylase n=1 Tax=Alkalilimnicola ehrlichii TaxID=351052 RepID=UPI00384F9600